MGVSILTGSVDLLAKIFASSILGSKGFRIPYGSVGRIRPRLKARRRSLWSGHRLARFSAENLAVPFESHRLIETTPDSDSYKLSLPVVAETMGFETYSFSAPIGSL